MEERYFNYINKILAFYENEQSADFENGIFKESSSEEMVLRRLGRAVKDEVCDNLLHSRYAIWAHDLINILDSSKDAIRRHDKPGALQQIERALNAIKAYKDILTVFDGEFYNSSDIFRGYAMHLLNLGDANSVVIEKDEIIRRLKEYSRVSRARLPRDMDCSIKNKVLRIFIQNPAQDMQNDSVAFEGWLLILKYWLSEEIDYVVLDFEAREDLIQKYGCPEACHYNRFLYRLYNMTRFFPTWFFVNESKSDVIFDFMHWVRSSDMKLNNSLQERPDQIDTQRLERQAEAWFVKHEGKSLLSKRWNIDENKLFNQLPTGVFIKKIAAGNAVFSRGASAIDMWGIDKDGQTLHLIELKRRDNKGLGVIGETLFYTALMYDTCVAKEPIFSFGKYGTAPDTSDMAAIKNNGNKFGSLATHILAEKYHPLFTDAAAELIRDGLKNTGIEFDRATYDFDKRIL
ncbi:MAG: hypothetical protein PHZ11_07965 [Desulfitobacteriaceae bacterium]|jgi:hypothetical protein|nr:hypothetical protein [Desulfitobacteriaceae bacterium]MDD4402031.1 hypothetical protein [Desulfitobacteriaceae bacterium]